eukprot:TRINITY_DN12353_c0_g1_i1.p1 TRINITY_DN12353_c0_g1~~TRINITY_DN12353_c0_g1_i1.p1  ORF type:complete len:124 (+),score=34.45 TRINITY_DN12353_c0_g1_i1:72-443(+)
MIRRPPRSTLSSSSAASDVYKRQLNVRVSLASASLFVARVDRAQCEMLRSAVTMIGTLDTSSDAIAIDVLNCSSSQPKCEQAAKEWLVEQQAAKQAAEEAAKSQPAKSVPALVGDFGDDFLAF